MEDKPLTYFAVRRHDTGRFLTGAGNSSLPTPRLYLTPLSAKNATEKYAPGYARHGYDIVEVIVGEPVFTRKADDE